MKLIDGKVNKTYEISNLNGVENSNHLLNLGMYEGAKIHIKSKGFGSLIVCIDGSRYGIGNDVANNIVVQ